MTRAVSPRYISYKTAQPVRQYITAGDADEQVDDYSLFRRQFVAALQGEGDVNGDGYITGSELGEFLQNTVERLPRDVALTYLKSLHGRCGFKQHGVVMPARDRGWLQPSKKMVPYEDVIIVADYGKVGLLLGVKDEIRLDRDAGAALGLLLLASYNAANYYTCGFGDDEVNTVKMRSALTSLGVEVVR